ncbi:metallophosphoesterase [Vallitalea okinawensis]|uniref:metallophosphoesterase n=1 Tax=Vallitalea okinawensis TaxID=2078660 RepID=UPI000CFC09E5|nr:metallophosphoesterase [Vallitalea okinawensis]
MNERIIHKRDNYKVVVMSDVHGHHKHLKAMVQKLKLSDEDYLIILGDFINRGPDSYKTYTYIRELEKCPNTIILKGNHEAFITNHLLNTEITDDFLRWLKLDRYETIITSLLKRHQKSVHDFVSGNELHDFMLYHHEDVFTYLKNLPIIVHFDDFIFVHGGYDLRFHPIQDEIKFLKYDHFIERSPVQEKKIIVGHWPVSNLRNTCYTNVPVFNDDKNIISIDGGLGVKSAGELNAFIIEKRQGKISYDYIQYNDFEKKVITNEYKFPVEETLLLNYTDWDVEIIEVGDIMTRCRHISSGKELTIFSCLLKEKDGKYHLATTYVNNFYNLDLGTEVALCQTYGEAALVKFEENFGWVMASQINE